MKRNLNKLSSNIEWTGEYNSKVKGEELLEGNNISISYSSPQFIYAKTRGTNKYTTTLEWTLSITEQLELVCSCSCPAYKNYQDPCKHIWGLIRKSEDLNSPHEDFLGAMKEHEIEEDIFLSTHLNCEEFDHLSLKSYQNKIFNEARESKDHVSQSPSWKSELANLEKYILDANEEEDYLKEAKSQNNSRVWYELEPYSGIQIYSNYKHLNISFHETNLVRGRAHGKLKKKSFSHQTINLGRYSRDAKYLNLLKGHLIFDYGKTANEAAIPSSLGKLVLKELVQSQRLFIHSSDYQTGEDVTPLEFREDVLTFSANIKKDNSNWILGGLFNGNGLEIDAQDATLSTDLNFLVHKNQIYQTELGKLKTHCEYLSGYGNIVIPLNKKEDLKRIIKSTIGLEQTLLDRDFGVEKKVLKGLPKVEIIIEEKASPKVLGQLKFLYDSELHTPLSQKDIFNDSNISDLFYLKDKSYERSILSFFETTQEVFEIEHLDSFTFQVQAKEINSFVTKANNLGIEVRTQGFKIKHYHSSQARIKSNNDWFELDGNIHFDKDSSITIPEIIKKKSLDKNFIILGDGTIGVKPNLWLKKMSHLSSLGVKEENRIKFNRAQAIILDLMLEETEVIRDNQFISTVRKLRKFSGVEKVKISKRFNGELRQYQESGVNWLNFLHQFRIGGCLADDMGLGKTIQVLAHLQKLKNSKKEDSKGQHLIVVPKSLVYNWQDEAEKFTPDMKVLIYEGTNRESLQKNFSQFDLVIMTYAVMRKDIQQLKDFEFSYSVLDEAQYIKNTNTLVAKAAYLINSKHKLALTGTPVENHLGELFSIFRYLIPNLLPKGYSSGRIKSNKASMDVILKGLMPFILRRTKQQVLTDLPEKVESILYCDFDKKQEGIYNEMKTFYQKSLTGKVDNEVIKKSKTQILEALLRMRQISCHPGLINKEYLNLSSSKINTLLESLEGLIERGEKVLIFSQFTSFLDIIKQKLTENEISYCYLDGKTRNRQVVVDNFKTNPNKSVFLISLKAGGVGLNLTEANYCFLVDPWWNPAVESQAIDRIHRIGQNKKVFAYRLITKGSIEEKIIKLQSSKRVISDNILATDESLLKQMSPEDLKFLFK